MNLNDTLNNLSYTDGTNYLINLLTEDGMKTILSNILKFNFDIRSQSFKVDIWYLVSYSNGIYYWNDKDLPMISKLQLPRLIRVGYSGDVRGYIDVSISEFISMYRDYVINSTLGESSIVD